MSKRNFSIAMTVLVALCAYTSYAWMDRWAPKLQGEPAKLSVLSTNAVVRFLQRNYADYEFSSKYAEGGEIDLNEDGIKDYVFFVPWMGNGLNASGYYTHFIVSDGKGGRIENSLDSFGAELADVVEINGKIYFRHSCFFGPFEKSAHNHWVFQAFSFGKDGIMRNANQEVGGHLPAVTIFYSDPKLKQIELTSADKAAILKGTKPQFRKFEINQ